MYSNLSSVYIGRKLSAITSPYLQQVYIKGLRPLCSMEACLRRKIDSTMTVCGVKRVASVLHACIVGLRALFCANLCFLQLSSSNIPKFYCTQS